MSSKIYKNVNVEKLTNELAHLEVFVFDDEEDKARVVGSDDTLLLVDEIVTQHNPTPIPPAPTKEEMLEQQITANTDYLLDVDFRLMLVELGML